MLPYIIKVAAVVLTSLEFDLIEDFFNGSFFMYSISLLAPIWYTVETVLDSGVNQNGVKVPVTATITTLVATTALYVLLYICSNNEDIIVSKAAVVVVSCLLMIWSIYLAYKMHFNDISVQEPNKKRNIDGNGIKMSMAAVEGGSAIGKKALGVKGDLENFSEKDFEEEEDE